MSAVDGGHVVSGKAPGHLHVLRRSDTRNERGFDAVRNIMRAHLMQIWPLAAAAMAEAP
ncbi:hypothetical protein [Rhodobacter lacus]|uniref:Transposase n=1 Tax=Rhodobacter lacus TaxID=1641972 RepID=A0ABW5AAS7_9RHOB